MIQIISARPLYAKGTASIAMFDTNSDDVVYSNNKLQTTQIQTTVNLGPIQGGIGNQTLINIPDTPNLTINMTAADFSLEAQGLITGNSAHFNAVIPVSESVTCAAGKLTVSGIPVPPLGTTTGKITATINNVAYEFGSGANSKVIDFPTGADGVAYCINYNVQQLQSKQLDINALFSPAITRAIITIPLFSTENAAINSSRAGNLYITIPRLQLNGDVNIDASQTTGTTTVLNATGLSFEEYLSSTGNACSNSEPKLAYMSVELYDQTTYSNVTSLVVVGGGVAGEENDLILLPLKALMNNGSVENLPTFADFTYTVAPETAGTVDADTGVLKVGTTSGTIAVAAKASLNRPDLKSSVIVSV